MENEVIKKSVAFPKQQINNLNEEDETLAIGEMFSIIVGYRWIIVGLIASALLFGVAWIFINKPLYKADGLIQVEEKVGSSGMSALKELQPLLGESTTISAEIEILTSRMVLGRIVQRLNLDIVVQPSYFPLIGAAVARRYKGSEPNSPLLGLSGYAWGGEVLKVDTLDVPGDVLDKPLILVAGEGGSFQLLDFDANFVLNGTVGARVNKGQVAIFVSQMKARPGTRFELIRRSSESAIDNLRSSFVVKERGKKSGMLEVVLTGPDQTRNVQTLDELLNTYVRKNVERRSAEAENTLKFLETQLPSLKKELDAAEAAYNSYRQSRGSLDLSIETQSVLQSVIEVDNQIVALKQERDEIRQSFTAEHPRIQAIDQRIERLRDRRKQFDGQVARLPDTQQKVLQLARDVEVSTTLYSNLLNTAQQLKVSKAGTVGDVRIIDTASASKVPVGLTASVMLFIAAFIGMLLSALVIIISRMLRVVVEDPELIESKLGLPVYATVPHSDIEAVLVSNSHKSKDSVALLALTHPEDDAVESLRGLRTTIHFALMDSLHNSILITGPSPGMGKSFISKNLGVVLAQAGTRVVIIDADLRRGHLNKDFGLRREIGVSEYISGTAVLDDIVKPTIVPNLWIVSTGQIPPNPSELLMHLRFEQLLQQLGEQFDMLVVDAPPILAVHDAAIIGRLVGATLMVARAASHPIQELEQAVKRLNNSGVEVKGFVFNDLNTDRQRYRRGYKGYVYRYSYNSSR